MSHPGLRRPEIAGPLGSLALSCVTPHSATSALRAVKWHQDLARLGVALPLFVVHDFGLALTCGPDQLALGPRAEVELRAGTAEHYRELVATARQSEAARRAGQLQMSDDLVVVVLARVLGDVARRTRETPSYQARLPLDTSLFEALDAALLGELYGQVERGFELGTLESLTAHTLLVVTLIDSLDVDTLRLFGMVGVSEGGALAQVELLESLQAPEANDIVNFSLEILPSVLETKARPAASTFAAFGYSGLGLKGSIDNLVLTELAWDDEELARRMSDNEVLYYAREQESGELGRQHLMLVDASASMRGDRATFARAMALATGKKLLLQGEAVSFRFFDSRLYEPHAAKGQELPTPHILSFKGERGRNPGRVFQDLLAFLELRRQPEQLIIHLYTHAALYIPRDAVAALKAQAQIAAVFILPSGGTLDLDYLDLLDAHWVVDHATLGRGRERADAARQILDQVKPTLAKDAAPGGARAPASSRPASSRGQRGLGT